MLNGWASPLQPYPSFSAYFLFDSYTQRMWGDHVVQCIFLIQLLSKVGENPLCRYPPPLVYIPYLNLIKKPPMLLFYQNSYAKWKDQQLSSFSKSKWMDIQLLLRQMSDWTDVHPRYNHMPPLVHTSYSILIQVTRIFLGIFRIWILYKKDGCHTPPPTL